MLEILRTGDVCSLVVGILILVWLGHWFANQRQKSTGGVLAVLTFLAYGMYAWEEAPPHDAGHLLNLIIRSLLACGYMLGLAWLVLPLVMGLWQLVRLAREASSARVREWEKQEEAWRSAELLGVTAQEEEREKAAQGAEQAKKHQEEGAKQQAAEEKRRAETEANARRRSDALAACDF